jgi:hypothetical protein
MNPMKPAGDQVVAYTGTAAASAAFGAVTTCVRLYSTTNCFVAFGAAPVAVVTNMPLYANSPEYFMVQPGSKVSAIQASAGGNLHISELTR